MQHLVKLLALVAAFDKQQLALLVVALALVVVFYIVSRP